MYAGAPLNVKVSLSTSNVAKGIRENVFKEFVLPQR